MKARCTRKIKNVTKRDLMFGVGIFPNEDDDRNAIEILRKKLNEVIGILNHLSKNN